MTRNIVDAQVGQRLKERRVLMGLSQQFLAEALEITTQQVQEYEQGADQIGALQLIKLCRALRVGSSYFYESKPVDREDGLVLIDKTLQRKDDSSTKKSSTAPATWETLGLVKAYYRIDDAQVRKRFVDLLLSYPRADLGREPKERC